MDHRKKNVKLLNLTYYITLTWEEPQSSTDLKGKKKKQTVEKSEEHM